MPTRKPLDLLQAQALKATLEEAQAAIANAQAQLSDHFADSAALMRDLDDAFLSIRKADARFMREIRDVIRAPRRK